MTDEEQVEDDWLEFLNEPYKRAAKRKADGKLQEEDDEQRDD